MTYKYAVLKTINNKLCVEVNENKKPEFECSNHTLEGKIYQCRVLNEWLQSCKYLDFASEEELRNLFKYFISQKLTNSVDDMIQNNINFSSIITIKEDLVYFKGNEESQEVAIDRLVGWFRKRVDIKDHEVQYLTFVMKEYHKLNQPSNNN